MSPSNSVIEEIKTGVRDSKEVEKSDESLAAATAVKSLEVVHSRERDFDMCR
jgi:hypothetical protein